MNNYPPEPSHRATRTPVDNCICEPICNPCPACPAHGDVTKLDGVHKPTLIALGLLLVAIAAGIVVILTI